MNYILNYAQAYALDLSHSGGKGYNLSTLHHFGFTLPKGVILSSKAYELFVERNGLTEELKEALALLTLDNVADEKSLKLLEKIEQKILKGKLPNVVIDELEKLEFLSHSLAVRSSASNEDSKEDSFAGIFKTSLNVNGFENLKKAIVRCYASLWTVTSLSYQLKKESLNSSMAIVIMQMVEAKSSGVSFSLNPLSGKKGVILMDANFGYGESVVDGAVESDHYEYNIENYGIESIHIGSKLEKTLLEDEGTTLVKQSKSEEQVLNNEQIEKLALLSQTVYEAFGEHQDIEWVYDGKDFSLLQARAITTIKELVPLGLSQQKQYFSNANAKDAAPFVFGKLNESFLFLSVNKLFGDSFRVIDYPVDDAYVFVKLFNGRLYFNLSLIQWLWYDALGVDPKETSLNLGGHQALVEKGELIPFWSKKSFRQIYNGIKYMRVLKKYVKRSDSIFEEVKTFCDEINSLELEALSNDELYHLIVKLNQEKSRYGKDFIVLTSAVAPMSILIKILEKYFPNRGSLIANSLLSGQSSITSAEHGYRLLELAKIFDNKTLFDVEFAKFIDEFGHRSVYEMSLGNSRWREDASYLLGLIEEYAKDENLDKLYLKQQKESKKVWREIEKEVPFLVRLYVKSLLKQSSHGIGVKEMAKSTYVRFVESGRNVFLEVGKRVGLNPFHCTQNELLLELENPSRKDGLQKLCKLREEQVETFERMEVADTFVDNEAKFSRAKVQSDGKTYKGIGVSSGVFQGKVRKIQHPDEYANLQKGEILLASSTDPSWTPMFLKASAIIVETGGYLSHGSIVAREYGLPAVVNIAGIMNVLQDGDVVLVNGDEGMISLVSKKIKE